MTDLRQIQTRCPNCGHEQPWVLVASINLDMPDPPPDVETVDCSSCGHKYESRDNEVGREEGDEPARDLVPKQRFADLLRTRTSSDDIV